MSAVVGAIIGAVAGLVGGFGNAIASDVEYKEKLKALEVKRSNLEASYNLAVNQTKAAAEESMAVLDANAAETKMSQGIGLRSSATNQAMQDAITTRQIAELQIEAAQARGAAVQDVALSGTRLMRDSEGNIVNPGAYNTARAADRSIAQAQAQRSLQRYQSLENARQNYYSADRQIASYGKQKELTRNELERTLKKYELAYQQEYSELTGEIGYMEDTSWSGGWTMHWLSNVTNVLSLGMSGASQGLSTYKEGKGYLWD